LTAHQLALFPPRKMSDLSVAWSDVLGASMSRRLRRLVHRCEWLVGTPSDSAILAVERKLRFLHFDQALTCDDWRVEWLRLEHGRPQYRLYRRFQLVGVAAVGLDSRGFMTSASCAPVRRHLAVYLVGLGLRAPDFRQVGAITPLNARGGRRLF